jgi:hypothetical protein
VGWDDYAAFEPRQMAGVFVTYKRRSLR